MMRAVSPFVDQCLASTVVVQLANNDKNNVRFQMMKRREYKANGVPASTGTKSSNKG